MSNNDFYFSNNNTVITGLRNKKLSEVIVPEGVKEIGYCAFSSAQFKRIYIPASVEIISDSAFEFCDNLEEITFAKDSSLKIIHEFAFSNCPNLYSIVFPEGLETIDYNAFYGCNLLKEVYIPSSVTKMGANIFEDCNSLKVINLAHNSIPSTFHMYWNEDNIKVNLVQSVKETSKVAPVSTNKVTTKPTVTKKVDTTPIINKKVENKPTIKPEDDLSDFIIEKDEKGNLIIAGLKNENLKTLIVPKSVKGIKKDAFYGNKTIESLVTHDEFEYIGTSAFAYSKIKTIKLGKNTFVGYESFYECEALENIHIPYDTGERAFGGCRNAKTIVIEDGVTSLNHNVCAGCSSLEELIMPDSIERISMNSFVYCSGLKTIKFSKNLTYIPADSFSRCSSLKEVTLPEKLNSIGEYAFYSCDSLEKINFNKSIISLDLCAFAQCNSITKLTIPASMMRIEKYALSSKNIKEITIEIYRGEKQEIPGSFIKTWYYEQAKPIIKFKTVNKAK